MMSKGFFKYFVIYIFSSCKIVYKIFILFSWRYFVFRIPNLCFCWLLNLWIVLICFLLDCRNLCFWFYCLIAWWNKSWFRCKMCLCKNVRTFCLTSRRNPTLIRKGFLSIGFSPLFLSLNFLNSLLCFFCICFW